MHLLVRGNQCCITVAFKDSVPSAKPALTNESRYTSGDDTTLGMLGRYNMNVFFQLRLISQSVSVSRNYGIMLDGLNYHRRVEKGQLHEGEG